MVRPASGEPAASNGQSWFSWFSFPFFAPLSGPVTQDISPSIYQGIPEIEAAVIQEAGSFGRQLGILSEAVLALADELKVRHNNEAADVEPGGDVTGMGML